jgi:hypothetical protein
MDKPLRPGDGGLATTLPVRPGPDGRPALDDRPGLADRPRPGDRPGIDDRPGLADGLRPGDRPGIGDRPGLADGLRPGDRPGIRPDIDNRPNFGDRNRWSHNEIINNRPQWANIDRSTNIDIHNHWNNAFVNPRTAGWWNRPAGRTGYWHGWADGVRQQSGLYQHDCFDESWWNSHSCAIGGWHYHSGVHNRPWSDWWTAPAWGSLTSWFSWSAPQTVWSQPVYYDYGAGGNVTYDNNYVYVGGEQVATADEFAQSAMDLATVAPPESEAQSAQAEWMPLGTYAVSTNEKDTEPSQVVQLAVSKEGIISGTLYNVQTDGAQAIQGQVDVQTQRVAFRIGESESIVAETGLYNMTQAEAPLLVHFGPEHTENYLLVRLEQPDGGELDPSSPQP